MRLLILGNADSWYVQDLRRAGRDRWRIETMRFEELDAWVGKPGRDVSVPREAPPRPWDAVLVRSMPRGSLEQVIFRMDVLNSWAARGVLVVNPPRSLEVAIDKYLALQRLSAAGINVPRTYVCQGWKPALAAFEQLGNDAVVKPLFGSEGRGITRISDAALAQRAFKMLEQFGAVIYLQQFVDHDQMDLRLFVLGQSVWAMRRHNDGDWRANISQGGRGEPMTVTPPLRRLALQSAEGVGALMAGVDVLIDRDGRPFVIELNAVPGWKALAHTLDIDVAQHVLEFLKQGTGETA